MNTATAPARARPLPRDDRSHLERPLAGVLLVVALALLSFFVHLVHESVSRGERDRVGRRAPVADAGRAAVHPAIHAVPYTGASAAGPHEAALVQALGRVPQ